MSTTDPMTPARIKSIRKSLGWTQVQLAHALGIRTDAGPYGERYSPGVSHMETGRDGANGPRLVLLLELEQKAAEGKRVPDPEDVSDETMTSSDARRIREAMGWTLQEMAAYLGLKDRRDVSARECKVGGTLRGADMILLRRLERKIDRKRQKWASSE